jgi:hypothetical protein
MQGISRPAGVLPALVLGGLLVALAPSRLAADDGNLPPEFLREHALVVHFLASAFDDTLPGQQGTAGTPGTAGTAGTSASRTPTWTSTSLRYTMSGAPTAIRLAGDDLVVIIQVTPYDHGSSGLVLVAQGQVWRRSAEGGINYRNAFESLSVTWGEKVFFFPLGLRPDGSAAMSLEITVDRYGPGAAAGQGGADSSPVIPGKR